jgi:hypothetical protein
VCSFGRCSRSPSKSGFGCLLEVKSVEMRIGGRQDVEGLISRLGEARMAIGRS